MMRTKMNNSAISGKDRSLPVAVGGQVNRLGCAVVLALCFASLLAAGCVNTGDENGAAPPAAQSKSESTGPDWQQFGESTVVSTDAPAGNSPLAVAIAKARETADDARTRWMHADPDDQQRWAIKWAAPIETGGVEYVWVRPEHWSRFRIEGVLITEPANALVGGGQRGDRVGFTAEQLADWVHIIDNGDIETRDGGFTIDVLNSE